MSAHSEEDSGTETVDAGGTASPNPEPEPGPDPDPDASLSYEQARDELTAVVRQLEAGGLTLAESLELWERGERLATTCEQWLEGARAKLHVAMSEENGENGDEQTPVGQSEPF